MSAEREFVLIGDHAENLHSGVNIGPGDHVGEADLHLKGEDGAPGTDAYLIDEGRLVDVASFVAPEPEEGPTVTELRKRASELEIAGRSGMEYDELLAAVQEAEAAAAAVDTSPDRGPDLTVGG